MSTNVSNSVVALRTRLEPLIAQLKQEIIDLPDAPKGYGHKPFVWVQAYGCGHRDARRAVVERLEAALASLPPPLERWQLDRDRVLRIVGMIQGNPDFQAGDGVFVLEIASALSKLTSLPPHPETTTPTTKEEKDHAR